MKKIVAWEKWRDNENYIEAEKNFNTQMDSDLRQLDDDDEDDGLEINLDDINVGVTVVPYVVRTPLGEFSVLDNNLPSKMFDCWICHTNFPITSDIANILDNDVNGIEVLRIISKYRFFIGIAKLFNFRDVASEIRQALCYDGEVESVNEEYVREYMSKYKDLARWAAFIDPTGHWEYITSVSMEDEEYDEKLESLKERSDGLLIEEIIQT